MEMVSEEMVELTTWDKVRALSIYEAALGNNTK